MHWLAHTSQTDVLIIGSGGAGLFAALHALQCKPDLQVTVATKGLLGKCGCTRMVQGGYNVALADEDSLERHFMDTIVGGKWLPHQRLAWRLVEGAVERVRELENELGCFFDRNADGSLHQKPFAGQSFDRTVHKGDLTGIEIINRLMEKTLASGVEKLEEHRAIGLIEARDGSGIAGALFIDIRSGDYHFVRAHSVLLASGGGPTMYRYHTPSGDKSCDGLAIALGLGLSLRDMEMVQFHPTGLLSAPDSRMTGTVLEEGLRGAGGWLLNADGERFMQRYDAAAERATRDVVSRSVYAEIRAGKGTSNGGVDLQMSHLGAQTVRDRFRGMVKRCADCGFDLANDRVEVVPTAHYMMGGIEFELDCSTTVPCLFVAGEDGGGVHGANRLGGNGVADSTVFGAIAGESMANSVNPTHSHRAPDVGAMEAARAWAERPLTGSRGDLGAIRQHLSEVMWNDAGILRTSSGLQRALASITQLRDQLEHIGVANDDRTFNLSWHEWMNVSSLVTVSETIVAASAAREESCGAHHREDHELESNFEDSYFVRVKGAPGALDTSKVAVEFSLVRPGESLIDNRP